MEKYRRLLEFCANYKSVAIAFSGGVDSSLLLYAASQVDGLEVVAVTAVSDLVPAWEIAYAREFAKAHGVKHIEIHPEPLVELMVRSNPPERCYHCKKLIISEINKAISEYNVEAVFEGSNLDDKGDYRPGAQAVKEAGLVSPFLECGFSKADIREVSCYLGLKGWDRPSCACLASRIPYGTELCPDLLKRVEKAEVKLAALGFNGSRVRVHGDVARIEVPAEKILSAAKEHKQIQHIIIECGFTYAALDLNGYTTGSMNKNL